MNSENYLCVADLDGQHKDLFDFLVDIIDIKIDDAFEVLNPAKCYAILDKKEDLENQEIMFFMHRGLRTIDLIHEGKNDASHMIRKFYQQKKSIFKHLREQLYHLSENEIVDCNVAPDDYKININQITGKLKVFGWVKDSNDLDDQIVGCLNTEVVFKIKMKIQSL